MFSKPIVLGVLASACLTAAAGGAYVAVRQNAVDRSSVALGAAAPAAASPAKPVDATEAIADEPPAVPASRVTAESPAPAAEAAPAPVHREVPRKVVPAATRTARPSAPARGDAPPTVSARAATAPAPVTAPEPVAPPPAPRLEPPSELSRLPEVPPAPVFIEVTVPRAAVIGLQVDRQVSSETARVEDPVEARVTRDVMAGGQLAIPAGSRALGSVTMVEHGGKMKETARIGVRFHTVILADGTRVPLRTETILREGDPPSGESARKIGGAAVGGAILGAILGGGKGAMIGGATGAGAGTAAVMAGGRNPAIIPAGAIVNAKLTGPVAVQVQKDQ